MRLNSSATTMKLRPASPLRAATTWALTTSILEARLTEAISPIFSPATAFSRSDSSRIRSGLTPASASLMETPVPRPARHKGRRANRSEREG